MQFKLFILSITITIVFLACQNNEELKPQNDDTASAHKVIVEEVINSNSYTYLNVKEEDRSYWMAVTKTDLKEGETLYYDNALEMNNFESKELQRTFETIYFIEEISAQPQSSAMELPTGSPHGKQTSKLSIPEEEISVEPVKGGISVAELFSNRNVYANKIVRIRGKVTKFNANIMGRNWIHIQDGSNDAGNYDLTVTSNDEVTVGDVVIFTGKITLGKDFGAGYSYEIIMEEAKTVK